MIIEIITAACLKMLQKLHSPETLFLELKGEAYFLGLAFDKKLSRKANIIDRVKKAFITLIS